MSGKVVQPAEHPTMEHTMTTHHKGYDAFFPNAGIRDEMTCRVCGATCDVQRHIRGPRSSIEAMSLQFGRKEPDDFPPYDRFTCPNGGEPWHDRARRLAEERDNTVSPSLRALIAADLERVIDAHT
jgi:hypothetical protein